MDAMRQEPEVPNAPAGGEPHSPLIRSGLGRAALFLGAFAVWMVLFGLAAGLVIVATGSPLQAAARTMNTWPGLAMDAAGMVGVLVLILLFRRFVDRQSMTSLGFSWDRNAARDLLAGMALGVGLMTSVFAVLSATGRLSVDSVTFPIEAIVVYGVFLALVAVEEEALCRGYLLLNTMLSMNRYLALLVISVVFSLLHLFNPNLSLVGYVNIILAGVLLGIYYLHKRNLWFPIGLHFTWNYFQGIVFGSPVSGVSTPSVLTTSWTGDNLLTGGEFGFEASLVTTVATVVAILIVHFVYRPRPASTSGAVPQN